MLRGGTRRRCLGLVRPDDRLRHSNGGVKVRSFPGLTALCDMLVVPQKFQTLEGGGGLPPSGSS